MGSCPHQGSPGSYLPSPAQAQGLQQEGLLRGFRHPARTPVATQLAFDNNSYLLTEEIYNRHGKKGKFEGVLVANSDGQAVASLRYFDGQQEDVLKP